MLKEDQKTQQVYLGSGLQQTLLSARSSLASKQATKVSDIHEFQRDFVYNFLPIVHPSSTANQTAKSIYNYVAHPSS